ncbi:AAA family ATPase [Methanocaldococcus sp.]
MKKLNWIRIENFRAFKKAEISNFGDINVFIGKNNTGKSTLLESIYLNLTQNNRDLLGVYPFRAIFSRRGISEIGRVRYSEIDDIEDAITSIIYYLFHSIDKREFNRIILSIKSNISEFKLNAYFGEFPEDILKKILKEYYLRYFDFDKYDIKYDIQPQLIISDENNNILFSVVGELLKNEIIYRIHLKSLKSLFYIEHQNVLMIDEYVMRSRTPYKSPILSFIKRIERYSKIDKKHLSKFLSDQLNTEIIDIISKIFDIFLLLKNNKQIPISLLGDGTKMALLYYYTLSLENTYILLEEPENHLHPKLMDKVIDLIINSSQKNQIFITTHNLEFLQKILEKSYEKNINLKVFAFENLVDGIPNIEVYECDEANAALNKIGVDLR